MGNINSYVTVTISKNTIGITRAGFGTFLALTQNAPFTSRVKTYADDASVAVDYANARSPERRLSACFFGQATSQKKLKFGRRANKSTMVIQLSVVAIRNSYQYGVWITGDTFDRTLVPFTSDSTATDAEIAAGFVTALNAVASKNYTATGAASPVSITATTAGAWFSVEIASPTGSNAPADDLKVAMTHTDPGVTADVTACAQEDGDFYMVYNFTNSAAEGTSLATWTEANKRTYMCDGSQTDTINTAASGGTDLFKTLNTSAFSRTYAFWHHRLDQMPGAGFAGFCLSFSPGTEAWHDKSIATVEATPWLTSAHRQNITDRKANGYEPVAGIGVTFAGTTSSGDYFDIIRLLDAFADDCSKAIFTTKTQNSKVGYDNPGIRLIANDFRGSINRFAGPGQGFDPDSIVVTVPRAEDVPSIDRSTRVLNGIKGFVRAVGAIATVNVSINVVA